MNLFEQPEDPTFPPLFYGEETEAGVDPFERAIARAVSGVDAGLVTWSVEPHQLRAAMVLTPETALEDAMAMVLATSLGFGDALGSLAPPEVGVHFDWPGSLRVNGARCGTIRAAASCADPAQEPDWLVLGLSVPMFSIADIGEPGSIPDLTTLSEEGCGEVSLHRLAESWVKHALVWINRWMADGLAPLHTDWRSRAYSMGEEISLTLGGKALSGTFVGLDEKAGLLLRVGDTTTLHPLSKMLETP